MKFAYIFPGQGSQYVGMGKELYEASPLAKAIFDKAEHNLGWELKKMCFEGPEDMLKLTHICQPAILTFSIACLEVLKTKFDQAPEYTAGLSMGEYSALVASGVLKFEDCLRLVRRRAELMNEAALKHPGKMAAVIGLSREEVKKICLGCGAVELANVNCPGQVVISGEKPAVDKAKELSLKKGAKAAVDLEVSGAFHCALMKEASVEFKNVLDERAPLYPPKVPVVTNVDALPCISVSRIMENLVLQIYKPVLWEDSIRYIASQGVSTFLEIGPGKVLKGLLRRIDSNLKVINIEKISDIENLSL